jgi:CRP/FNR family cyclic AMP-dependent transcriptional regulator
MENIDALKKNCLFKGLEDNELMLLANLTRQKNVTKNTFVIKEGECASEMYLIKKGKAIVMLNNDKGKEMVLSKLEAGDIFGELALLDDTPRSANVVTQEDCELLILRKADFFDVLNKNPKVAIQVIRYLCQKLRLTNSVAQSYALMDVYERLRKFLYDMAMPDEEGSLVVSNLAHKDIAFQVCTGREVISRMLSLLEKEGYIKVEKKTIILLKELPTSL